MQLKNLLNKAIASLKEVGIKNPILDARILLYHATKIEPILYPDIEITKDIEQSYKYLIERRIKREPVAKIIGNKSFWKDEFYVNEYVLDPRPDTEIIIEEALELLPDKIRSYSFLDLGTGTGCLLISLLNEFKNSIGIASDISLDALFVAKINAANLNIQNRIGLIQQNWSDSVKKKFDLIVSNPPYIRSKDISSLDLEVKNYDPILALNGGEDGLNHYRYLSNQIKHLLKSNACAILEFGYDQGKEVREIFIQDGYNVKKMLFDLSGIERAIVVEA